MTPPRPDTGPALAGHRSGLAQRGASPSGDLTAGRVAGRMHGCFVRQGAWALLGALALLGTVLPAHAADIHKGAELYRQHCAACHGGDGLPVVAGATDFARPTALLKPDMTLLAVIRSGKGAMPAFQGQLRDREMADIVAHLRTRR